MSHRYPLHPIGPLITSFVLAILLTSTFLSSLLLFAPDETSISGTEQYLSIEGTRSNSEEQGIKYAIITTSDLSETFEDLKNWRSMTGLKSEIYILDGPSGILSQYPGSDDAEKLFHFISYLYENNEGSLEYLLLGGDDDKVPTRYLWANASRWDYDDQYLSDVYFSSPNTDWDRDGDGRYGEREDIESIGIENISFPIKVGRFPVSSIDEARIMVQKVIGYEISPDEGNWTKRGVIASSLMEAPNIINDPLTPEDEGFDDFKDNGYKAFLNYTYRFLPRSLDLIEFHDYEMYVGGSYSNANDSLSVGDISGALDQGCSFFTFAGQSFYDIDSDWDPPIAYSLAQYIDPWGLSSGGEAFGEALTYEDTWNLSNGQRLPVAYISSCDSANFSSPGDTSLENMVRSPNGGAICLIGSTGVSWRGEGTDYSLGNWYLLSRFWEKMMTTGRPGDSLFWLKQDYIDNKWDEYATKEVLLIELYTYNLLGDPALSAWIGAPLGIQLKGQTSEHYAGGDTYSARVTDMVGNPLSNVRVSIYMNSTGDVFSSTTGPDGYAEVQTSFISGGPVQITASGRNLIPVTLQTTVLDQPVDLMVDGSTLEIGPLPLTEGELAVVQVTIRNIGGRDAIGAEAWLMSGTISYDPDEWPDPIIKKEVDLAAGSSIDLEFEISPSRSWDRLTIALISSDKENDIGNNLEWITIDVNAKPRFLPMGLLEIEEDQEGGGSFDLSSYVYDPDNDPDSLSFFLGTGSPSWCSLEGSILDILPPENWSGAFDITLRVSDGLAFDLTYVGVFVNPVNDAPVVLDLQSSYTAYIDTPFSLVLQTFDAEGEATALSIHTDLERIKISGRTISFVPYIENLGEHEIIINISDTSGGNNTYSFNLSILPPLGRLFFEEPSVHLPSARAGSSYNYKIRIGGDLSENATFSDDSDLFNIDPTTGIISFKPGSEDKGDHWITITVDSGGSRIERTFFIQIKEERENDPLIYWILGSAIAILLLLVIAVVLWSGPRVEQYGLEE